MTQSIPHPPILAALVLLTAPLHAGDRPPEVVEFNRHVRPILSNSCFKCHGPDVDNNKSPLRLDTAEAATRPLTDAAGRTFTGIVPGRPEQSEVWRRITSKDEGERMPPPESLHQLGTRDKAVLRRWIEQGAEYQPHWAYLPPRKTGPAAGPGEHPVDRLLLAALEERGLKPSPEADRRTLARRLSLDLTGLPPTPEEVEAFAGDEGPDAHGRFVDRLLASPHYGERMAVPWLDLARFADTVGFHGDQRQNVFPYRDYVIDAFNRNLPYDQFVREQLAGDLLPAPTEAQLVATGFNRLNMMTREGGAQPKEYLAKYAADRVRTVTTTFLGSTVGCAECHDHKYDPFTTRDFYSLAAFFADIKQYGVYSDYKYTPEPELKGWSNDHPFPPEIEVESAALQGRLKTLRDRQEARLAAVVEATLADPAGRTAVREWSAGIARVLAENPEGWSTAKAVSAEAAPGTAASLLPDGAVRFERAPLPPGTKAENPNRPSPHVVTFEAAPGPVAVLRLTALPDEKHGGTVARDKKERFTLRTMLAVQRAGATAPEPLALDAAFPDGATDTYDNGYHVTSVLDRWTSAHARNREPQSVEYVLREPLVLAEGDRLVARLMSTEIGRVRIEVTGLGGSFPGEPLPAAVREAFLTAEPSPEQLRLLAARHFFGTGAGDREAFAAALTDRREIADCREGRAFTMVTVATEPAVTRVLPRGNWQDESGEVVAPAPPEFLVSEKPEAGARRDRLDLAEWIVSRGNPLTARTFVNRLWKQFFGTGLSAAVDDLGLQGEYPSHPELLDWLAVEFMESGWDVKAMVKLMVTSAAYRRSSVIRPELGDVDPLNRLLARQSPRRLEAEFVRDNALFAAGLLLPDIGGPSALPYQPEGYYAQLNFPIREYRHQADERQYRRGLYTHWQRTFLHPTMADFDAPAREECTASRTVSNTPQQALALLNDPTFVEAARALAERVVTSAPAGDFLARLDEAFRRVLARPPAGREAESLRRHYEAQLATYRAAPDDAEKLASVGLHRPREGLDLVELAAWTSVARVILNLNESIVIY